MSDIDRARWQRLVDEALTVQVPEYRVEAGWFAMPPLVGESWVTVWTDGRDPGDEDRS